jgi:hypothetical protein
MQCLIEQRVFFKRKARQRLAAYWAGRRDAPEAVRAVVFPAREVALRVAAERLDGLYVSLERWGGLWFKGAFRAGGARAPVPLSAAGLGPRELVVPAALALRLEAGGALGDVTLVGDWYRYQLCAASDELVEPAARRGRAARLRVRVDALRFGPSPPVAAWAWAGAGVSFGPVGRRAPTVCLVGTALDSPLAGRALVVPLRELCWAGLGGGVPWREGWVPCAPP